MKKHEIYFARMIDVSDNNEDANEGRHAFCHVLPSGATRSGSGLPLEFLAGYFDGATFGRWNEFRVFAGVPAQVATRTRFKGLRLAPLDAPTISELYELADLDERDVRIERPRLRSES